MFVLPTPKVPMNKVRKPEHQNPKACNRLKCYIRIARVIFIARRPLDTTFLKTLPPTFIWKKLCFFGKHCHKKVYFEWVLGLPPTTKTKILYWNALFFMLDSLAIKSPMHAIQETFTNFLWFGHEPSWTRYLGRYNKVDERHKIPIKN